MAEPSEAESEELEGQETSPEINPLDVSDADFEKMAEPGSEPVAEEPEPESENEEEEDGLQEEEQEDAGESNAASEQEEDVEKEEEPKQGAEPFAGSDTQAPAEKPSGTADAKQQAEEGGDKAIDYKAEHDQLFAPFRANGKDMQISSVEDARTLMQMGANYNKKMAALKPNLKILKMLENNELLDEQKLSYLIDLDKKDPDAIAKLVKDSGVDPLDIDPEGKTDYKPKAYTVDDKEVELDSVLEEIRDTPTYQETLDTVGNKWDDASKKVVLDNPGLLRVINAQIDNGIYQQIMGIVEQERVLGRLTDISDFEAYKFVGDTLQAQGAFNKPAQAAAQPAPAGTPKADPALKSRKRAASPTKNAARKKPAPDFNPLAVSDEEFEKISTSKFM